MAAPDSGVVLQGIRWDLRYTASALRTLQMTAGSLEQLCQKLMVQGMGTGLSPQMQELLILAGQRSAEPGLKFKELRRRLVDLGEQGRMILISWAAADFCRAVMELVQARLEKSLPAVESEDDDL